MHGNFEYRITIAGPVAIAPFVDTGTDPILRTSQLQINPVQYETLQSTLFGCPILGPQTSYACSGGHTISGIPQYLNPVPGTNWVVRMSTGLELQTMLPVVNAPFRIYYAYNAMRLNGTASPPIQITRSMFPCPTPGSATCQDLAAGNYTYNLTRSTLGSTLHSPGTAKNLPLHRGHNVLRAAISSQLSALSSLIASCDGRCALAQWQSSPDAAAPLPA